MSRTPVSHNKWGEPDERPIPGQYHVRHEIAAAADTGYMFGKNFPDLQSAVDFMFSGFGQRRLLVQVSERSWLRVDWPLNFYAVFGREPDAPPAPRLTLQAGRYYRRGDGVRVGPMFRSGDVWYAGNTSGDWGDNGVAVHGLSPSHPRAREYDLVEEWSEGAGAPELLIAHPLLGNRLRPAVVVLRDLAGQEGCDGEPYDTMSRLADLLAGTQPPSGCSCHPGDNPPRPCPGRQAYSECAAAAAHVEAASSQQVETALRVWEQHGGTLRYGEVDGWHVSDRIRMLKVIQALVGVREMPEASTPGSECRGDSPGTRPGEACHRPGPCASPEPTGGTGPFRLGHRVPEHIYEGDRPIHTARSPEEAVRLVRLLNAGIAALSGLDEWSYDMEAAPQDGTPLLCVEYDDPTRVVDLHWFRDGPEGSMSSWRGDFGQLRRPAAWRRSPAPPRMPSGGSGVQEGGS